MTKNPIDRYEPRSRGLFFLLALAACSGGGQQKGSPTDGHTAVGDDDDTTTSAVEVYINEVMAQNRTGLQDEGGAFPDWVELYNGGEADVNLAGYWLSDDTTLVFKWQFPDVTIAAGEHLVVFCDEDLSEGPLHTSFLLGGLDGEDLALFGPNGEGNPLLDSIEDMALATPDVSLARMPDGGPTWEDDASPTPNEPNE